MAIYESIPYKCSRALNTVGDHLFCAVLFCITYENINWKGNSNIHTLNPCPKISVHVSKTALVAKAGKSLQPSVLKTLLSYDSDKN